MTRKLNLVYGIEALFRIPFVIYFWLTVNNMIHNQLIIYSWKYD